MLLRMVPPVQLNTNKSTTRRLKEKYLKKLKEVFWSSAVSKLKVQMIMIMMRSTKKNLSLYLNWKPSLKEGQYTWESSWIQYTCPPLGHGIYLIPITVKGRFTSCLQANVDYGSHC